MRRALPWLIVVLALWALLPLAYSPARGLWIWQQGGEGGGSQQDLGLAEEASGVPAQGGDGAPEGGGLRLLSEARRSDPALEAALEAERAAARAAAQAAALAAQRVDWAGVLRDAQGQPVAGARLLLADEAGTLILVTLEDGSFSAQVVPGRYDLLVTVPGRGSLFLDDYLVDGVARLDLELVLAPTVTLRVLLQRDGRGVEGARATLARTRGNWPVSGASTDVDGRVAFAGLAAGSYVLRMAVPQGPELVQSYELKQDMEVVARVPDAVELRGTVTDAASKQPVAGAVLRIATAGRDAPGFVTSAASREDGTFALFVPKGAAREVEVRAEGYAPWPAAQDVGRVLGSLKGLASGTAPVVLAVPLAAGGGVAGRVEREGTREPLAGIVLRLRAARGAGLAEAVTDADGAYAVAHLNPGRYTVEVASPGWFPLQPLALDLPRGRTEPLRYDIRLASAGVLTGSVVMGAGAPVKGARVWLMGGGAIVRSARGAGRPLETFTSAAGTWTLSDVPPTLAVTVRAQLGALEATPANVHMQRPPATPLRLVLAGSVNLQGRVIDQREGTPVAGARVQASPQGPPWGREGRNLATDAQGAFRMEGLIPGDYDVQARRGDYLVTPPRTITLSADDPEERLELALDPGLVLAGMLVDERGVPLAGRVTADGTPDGASQPLSRGQAVGSDGRFRLTGFQPGTYRLRASAPGTKGVTLTGLRGGEERMRLVLVSNAPRPN